MKINVFGYENKQAYPVYFSKEHFKNCMNLLLLVDYDKSHCLYEKL